MAARLESAGPGLQTSPAAAVPARLAEVTGSFVEAALRHAGVLPDGVAVEVEAAEPTAVQGLLSSTGRVRLSYHPRSDSASARQLPGLPASVIVKLQAESEANRQIALGADNYAMERRFYESLAAEAPVGTPRCFRVVSEADSGNVVFVLEDLCLRQGLYAIDQFRPGGCTLAEAKAVAAALGALHARYWSWSSPLPAWLPETSEIGARDVAALAVECAEAYRRSSYFQALGAAHRGAAEAALACASGLRAALRVGPRTLLHHDLRADNLFWSRPGAAAGVVVLDWQMVGQGVGPLDLAWFASSSFLEARVPGRAREGREVLEAYWRALTSSGVDGARYSFEAAWRDFLLGLLWSFLVSVQAVKFGEPTEVLATWLGRAAHAMVDAGAHKVPLARLAAEEAAARGAPGGA